MDGFVRIADRARHNSAMTRAAALAVASITFVVFIPALSNSFVDWDDRRTIVENVHVHGLSAENIRWMFTTFHMGHYQPLALLTLATDYQVWGLEPFGYHLTSVIIHSVNAAVFFLLCLRLLRLGLPATSHTARVLGAGVAALLFSVHPLRVESVAWATQRRDVLSAGFYLLAVLACVTAHDRRVAGRAGALALLGSLAAMAFSLLAKVSAVTLVPVFVVLDLWPLRRLKSPLAWLSRDARPIWLEKLPFVALALLAGLAAPLAQARSNAWAGLEPQGLPVRVAGALYSIAFYLWKTVWPVHLSPLYEMPRSVDAVDWRLVAGGAIFLCIGPALLLTRRRWGPFLTSWTAYMLLVAPVLGVFQRWPQIAADRYTYLACLPWPPLVCGAFLHISSAGRRARAWRVAGLTVAMLVTVALAAQTWRQNGVWTDTISLWRHVLSIRPDTRIALGNLGSALLLADSPGEAERRFRDALRVDPGSAPNHANLGLALVRLGRDYEALQSFRQAVALDPSNSVAHTGVGMILGKQSRYSEAEEALRLAIAVDPANTHAHAHLGNVLRSSARPAEAVQHFRRATALEPRAWQFRRGLAESLVETGDLDAAIAALREAVEADSADPRRRDALSRALLMQAGAAASEALDQARIACEATGYRVPEYLGTLAGAYAANHDAVRALHTLEQARELAARAGRAALLKELEQYRDLVRAGQPVRISGITAPSTLASSTAHLDTRPQH